MKRLLIYVKKHTSLVIIPFISMLAAILLDMINPFLVKIIVDRILKGKDYAILNTVLLALAAITVGRAVFGYIKEYVSDLLAVRVAQDLKQDLFDHIQSLPFSYFDNMNTGELMSRIGEDVDNIWRTIAFGIRLFIENIIYFVIATCLLFYLSWKLTLFCIVALPPIAFLAMKLEKKIGTSFENISDQNAVLSTTAQENIAGVRLVKAFSREKHEILKFLELNKKNYDLNVDQSNIIARYFPPMEFFTNVSIVLMITVGGILVINDNISLGTLVAFNGYIWNLIWPMRMLGWLTNMIAQNNASANKIFKILDLEPAIKDSDACVTANNIKGDIEFRNVSFKYKEEYVLRDVSLKVKAGSTVAIMGTTGSGKSSIINLIGRYYDIQQGKVSVDGINVKNLCLKDLRSSMAVVSQDVFLFSDSIGANIRFGKENATEEEIIKACKIACAHDFIYELEEGYETVIGERGIGLSGGQKQRISIARALASNAKILVLDDATSALDMETEYELLKNLHNKKNKPTTFIIAHRISAVKNADEIIFLEDGRIIEKGTHNELLEKGGKYYEVYCEQFKDFEEIEGEVV